jgi:hypothetical protein
MIYLLVKRKEKKKNRNEKKKINMIFLSSNFQTLIKRWMMNYLKLRLKLLQLPQINLGQRKC